MNNMEKSLQPTDTKKRRRRKRPRRIRQNWFFRFLRNFVKLFKKRPLIYDHNEDIVGPAIFVSNHSGAAGPMDLSMFFPYYFVPWGAHEMRGNYRTRWKYLYYVFYQQKLHYGKFKSFFLATILAVINPFLYANMRLIPTYQDIRFKKSLRESLTYLDDGIPILVFPEDSSEGYFDTIIKFNEGVVVLADYVDKHRNLNIPIYPVYYSKRAREIEIGKPAYYRDLKAKGHTRSEIADILRKHVNTLFENIKARKARNAKAKERVRKG